MSARSDTMALRKRMLVARANLERLEIGEQIGDVRRSLRSPRLFGASLGKLAASGGVSTLIGLWRRYPVLSAGASMVLSQVRKRVAGAHPVLGTALTAASVAALAWQAWRVWQRQRPPHDEALR